MAELKLELLNEIYIGGGAICILAKANWDNKEKHYFYYYNISNTQSYCIAEKGYKNEWVMTYKREKSNIGLEIGYDIINKPANFFEQLKAIREDYGKKQYQKAVEEAQTLKNILQEFIDVSKKYKWNGKVYGKKGSYSIYLNNEKYEVSDEQANTLKKYEDKHLNTFSMGLEKTDYKLSY